ncbi:hypothetical protein ACG02S_14575 [Roseateles sp. DC23W]|uniref:DUF2946 domain-containing protein n=1 Tax=Pelomonas dachongensis TaxID=3299029 RepID=A0ABW7ENY5_9BURK
MRFGRVFVLCLLLALLPLRSLLAATQLECMPPAEPAHAGMTHEGHAHHQQPDAEADHEQACKLCAPCCLAAAPPPALTLTDAVTRAERARQAAATRWADVVPPLPDPPPRG